MTDCPNGAMRDRLPDYLHDRLLGDERRAVESHLAVCAPCREELALLRDLRSTLRRAPRVDVETIAASIPPYRAPARGHRVAGWRAAAAIAAILVGGASLTLLHRASDPGAAGAPSTFAVAGDTSRGESSVGSVPSAAATREELADAESSSVARPMPVAELAIGGGSIGELSDGELTTLLDDLENLESLPSAEVEVGEALPTSMPGVLR
jgi:anti-sigma factor RsiW